MTSPAGDFLLCQNSVVSDAISQIQALHGRTSERHQAALACTAQMTDAVDGTTLPQVQETQGQINNTFGHHAETLGNCAAKLTAAQNGLNDGDHQSRSQFNHV